MWIVQLGEHKEVWGESAESTNSAVPAVQCMSAECPSMKDGYKSTLLSARNCERLCMNSRRPGMRCRVICRAPVGSPKGPYRATQALHPTQHDSLSHRLMALLERAGLHQRSSRRLAVFL